MKTKNDGFILTPIRRCDLQEQGGFIALISVIVITLVLITVTVALATKGFLDRFNILDGENKEISAGLASACVESARIKIARDPAYDPKAINPEGEKLNVGDGNCEIVSVVSGVVCARGVHERSGATTYYRVVLDGDQNITEFREVTTQADC